MKTPRTHKDHGTPYGEPPGKKPKQAKDGATRPVSNDGTPWPDPPPPPEA